MKALTWLGRRSVELTDVPDPQVREHGMGASLLGYTKLYGQVPGAQAEYLRVPHADHGPITGPHGPFLSGETDPLGVDGFATPRLPLEAGPEAYETFQKQRDRAIKIVFQP